MKRFLSLLLLLFLVYSLSAQQTRHVLVVVIDGVRYSETFGDPAHQWIPKIWTELRPQGVIYPSYSNDGLTETNPGHASIVTGTWQTIANDGSARPHAPTMFEYFRKERATTAAENVVVLGKSKLNILAFSDHAQYGSSYGASVTSTPSQYNDQLAADSLKRVLRTNHPRLAIVNFPNPDNVAHSNNWGGYLTSVRNADSLTYEIWTAVQSDSVMKGRTTMVVTNDHGRHLTDFANHGDGCEGCRHLMLLIVGPDTPHGVVDSTARKQIDIVPTIGALLGFSTPYATGSVIASALMITGVAQSPENRPQEFRLLQNYPNPFNPSTEISYAIAFRSDVQLHVFDAVGQRVAELVATVQDPGVYTVSWSPRMASGVYFARLEARSDGKRFVDAKRMMVIK